MDKVFFDIDGKETHIAYLKSDDKTDYVYNLKEELVATIYNNDYKVAKILSKLAEEQE